jgi:hypothetical protein
MAWVREWTIPTERPALVGEASAKVMRIERATWSAWHPYGHILTFLGRSRYFFFQVAPHQAEWTPFQTHYCSENLVEPGIEPSAISK